MMEFSIESDSSNNFAGAGRGAGRSNVNNSNQAQAQAVQSPYRPLYLMVFRSALFKAHWSFWAPALDDGAQKVGQRVHVTGNVRNGFQLEFVRNYDLTETSGYPTIIEIGAMRTEILQDTPLDRREFREDTPRDRFEFIAQSIPAPSGSLNKVNEQPRIAIATESANRNAGLTGSSGSTVGQGDRTVSHDISNSSVLCCQSLRFTNTELYSACTPQSQCPGLPVLDQASGRLVGRQRRFDSSTARSERWP